MSSSCIEALPPFVRYYTWADVFNDQFLMPQLIEIAADYRDAELFNLLIHLIPKATRLNYFVFNDGYGGTTALYRKHRDAFFSLVAETLKTEKGASGVREKWCVGKNQIPFTVDGRWGDKFVAAAEEFSWYRAGRVIPRPAAIGADPSTRLPARITYSHDFCMTFRYDECEGGRYETVTVWPTAVRTLVHFLATGECVSPPPLVTFAEVNQMLDDNFKELDLSTVRFVLACVEEAACERALAAVVEAGKRKRLAKRGG